MRYRLDVLGVQIDNMTFEETTAKIKEHLRAGKGIQKIVTPNPEIVMAAQKNKKYKDILNRADYVTVDGIGLVYAAKIKGKSFKERVTGYDLSLWMLEELDRTGGRLFILGGEPGIAEKACDNIKEKYKNLIVAGHHHGYFKGTHIGHSGHDEEREVIDKINESNADILFVCLGAYKQELWIDENAPLINCKLAIGNGGVADVIAGKVKGAPEAWRKIGLEWLYRLKEDPKRFKRQLAIPKFILKILFTPKAVTDVQN